MLEQGRERRFMRLKCIGCEALARILYLAAAHSPQIVDLELFRIGFHNEPADLRARLQDAIDQTDAEKYDAIVLGYGLCGNAVAGLVAREIPVIIPRAHDCITLFLGDRERYQQQFWNFPGTFWYSQDYIERKDDSVASLSLGWESAAGLDRTYEEYVETHGKDNADYLMEVMGAWQAHYQRAAFIDMGVGDSTAVEVHAKSQAVEHGWTYERLVGDLVLIRHLLNGTWDDGFLKVEPGHKIVISHDDDVVRGEPSECSDE